VPRLSGTHRVRHRALAILEGKARQVATGIRRRASSKALPPTKRTKADACARYLINKANHLDYPTALAYGWPIATGVIEGACRHLVKDRMDITGARWSSEGAEAVLKLRAVRTNGDFEAYWRYHLEHERARLHASRYTDGLIPIAAWSLQGSRTPLIVCGAHGVRRGVDAHDARWTPLPDRWTSRAVDPRATCPSVPPGSAVPRSSARRWWCATRLQQ
jgi:hypothetical protein